MTEKHLSDSFISIKHKITSSNDILNFRKFQAAYSDIWFI